MIDNSLPKEKQYSQILANLRLVFPCLWGLNSALNRRIEGRSALWHFVLTYYKTVWKLRLGTRLRFMFLTSIERQICQVYVCVRWPLTCRARRRGPASPIPSAPIGAVVRMANTANVSTSNPNFTKVSSPSSLAMSNALEPIAACHKINK